MMTSKSAHKPTTALYLRISLDDDNNDISNSIVNQRDLLSAYVANDPVLSASGVLIFADDGWSGTNFERPQVKLLLDMVKRGEVQNIVVKDTSRWGRNYVEVSEHLDQIFPFLGVRFISVNDQYDSADHKGQTAPMGVAFSSIVHDIYSKELSVKVTQGHLAKAKKGEYVCGTVPYGFIRPKEKDNHIIIDEQAAIIIKRIFDMAADGTLNTEIATILNTEGIDSPLEHRRRNGRSTLALQPKAGRSFWDSPAIRRILGDERYVGTMVFGKTKKSSRSIVSSGGRRHEIKIPEADWVKVPDALPAIVSMEVFEKVQANRRRRAGSKTHKTVIGIKTIQPTNKTPQHRSPFVGKVICGHCNHNLTYNQTSNPYFSCLNAKRNIGMGCYGGMVRISELEGILLTTIKVEAQKTLDLKGAQTTQNQRQGQTQEQVQNHAPSQKDVILSELKRLTTNIALLEQQGLALYEKFAEGKVDREAYVKSKAINATDSEVIQTRIAELNKQLAGIENITTDTQLTTTNESVLHHILSTAEATEEVHVLLNRMIVYDDERIEVRFNFSDSLSENSF